MTKEWKGETVQMPEAFGIKSGKSAKFGRIKARLYIFAFSGTMSSLPLDESNGEMKIMRSKNVLILKVDRSWSRSISSIPKPTLSFTANHQTW